MIPLIVDMSFIIAANKKLYPDKSFPLYLMKKSNQEKEEEIVGANYM